jgi:hypothetical protein
MNFFAACEASSHGTWPRRGRSSRLEKASRWSLPCSLCDNDNAVVRWITVNFEVFAAEFSYLEVAGLLLYIPRRPGKTNELKGKVTKNYMMSIIWLQFDWTTEFLRIGAGHESYARIGPMAISHGDEITLQSKALQFSEGVACVHSRRS